MALCIQSKGEGITGPVTNTAEPDTSNLIEPRISEMTVTTEGVGTDAPQGTHVVMAVNCRVASAGGPLTGTTSALLYDLIRSSDISAAEYQTRTCRRDPTRLARDIGSMKSVAPRGNNAGADSL